MSSQPGKQVSVFVRTRPTANFAQDLIEYLPDGKTVNVFQQKDSRKQASRKQLSSWSFQLDGVLHDVSQEEVYEQVAQGVVLRALDGYNGTVMCFGQTGAGKTYTMTGATESYKQRGIIPRALQEVFQEVESRSDYTFSVLLSYLEIYNETLMDLLGSVRDSPCPGTGSMSVVEEPNRGVSVRGLSLHTVRSEEEALNLLFEGEMNRIIGAHALNKNSSRSHCILTLHIESRNRIQSDAKYVTSKLNLVDLAGSERLGKTGSEGQVFKEAMYINKSLSFLEQTILALADRCRNHVPFRQTKLTHALKDSLGGNCNTVLIANIYGEAAQIEETLSTLRFASRMNCVRTNPAVNEHIDPLLHIKRLERENQMLREELSVRSTLANRPSITHDSLPEGQEAEIRQQVQRYLEGSLEEISITSLRQVQVVFAQFKIAMQEEVQKAQLCRPDLEKTQSPGSGTSKDSEPIGSEGQTEGRGFGVGVAALSERYAHQPSPGKAKTRKAKEMDTPGKGKAQRPGTPGKGKGVVATSKSRLNTVQKTQKEQEGCETESQDLDTEEPQEPSEESARTSSPPPKAEAFEDFKAERGGEINRILKENKVVLLERRARLRQLTEELNEAKREIDSTAASLRQHKDVRESQGQFVSAEGDPVLDEPEVNLVLRLRELKTQYRQMYEELRSTKAEVNYCQHLVDQCRTRLLTEFESWYNESFLLPEEVQAILRTGGPIQSDILLYTDKAHTLEEDDRERFERLQYKLIVDNPSAASFYNAHHKTLKRRNNKTLSQRNSPKRSGRKKCPPIPPIS